MNRNSRNWRMPSTYLKLILQAADSEKIPPQPFLDGTLLVADELLHSDHSVTFKDTYKVLENAERLFGAGWHLEVGQRLTVAAHGPLGFAAVTAPNLDASLQVLLRFMSIRAPFLWAASTVEDEHLVLRLFDTVDMGNQRETLVELTLLSLQGLIERPLGREIEGASLSFAYARPVYGDALTQVFHPELGFDAEQHALRLPLAWLSEPCALYDESMHRYLLGRCNAELAASAGGLPAEVAVRQALLATPGLLPGLVETAASQHLSPRTLIRRLGAEGTSFKEIRDDVRQTLARDYLLNTDLSVYSIAERLGYQDASNFSRAFRRWTGLTPSAFRRKPRFLAVGQDS